MRWHGENQNPGCHSKCGTYRERSDTHSSTVAGNTLTTAPPPDAPGDYDGRYEMVQHLRDTPNRLAGPYDLTAGEFMIVRTGQFYSAWRARKKHTPTAAHTQNAEWFNTRKTAQAMPTISTWRPTQTARLKQEKYTRCEGRSRKAPLGTSTQPGKTWYVRFPGRPRRASEQRAVMPPPAVRMYLAGDAGAKNEATSTSGLALVGV
jgi:hypothetical protein